MHLLYSQLPQRRHKSTEERHKTSCALKSEQTRLFSILIHLLALCSPSCQRCKDRGPPHTIYIRRRNFKSEVSFGERIKCFPSIPFRRNSKTQLNTGHFGFVCKNNRSTKSHDYRGTVVFKNIRFQNVFGPKPAFSNCPGFKSVFEKLHYRKGSPERRISVNGRPNRRNTVAFSNFSA